MFLKAKQMCVICGSSAGFRQDSDNLRESLRCLACRSISRDRHLIWMLSKYLGFSPPLKTWKRDKTKKILETTGARAHPNYLRRLFDYYNTAYDANVIAKGNYDIRAYADLQNLPYKDCFFDIMLSSDVFEHVRLYERAFAEVYRVLKIGGALILQVPFVGKDRETVFKVKPDGNTDVFLSEPEYHASMTLVYRLYGGKDLFPLLQEIGFKVCFIESEVEKYGISYQPGIVLLKSGYVDLTNFLRE